jgi:hypothetical protein
MARFTMESGPTVSLKATELRHGLMEGDTKASGSKESQSEKAWKHTKMELPSEESGKEEYSQF